jgi:hypothetical protein
MSVSVDAPPRNQLQNPSPRGWGFLHPIQDWFAGAPTDIDVIDGGTGNDVLTGGAGNDSIDGSGKLGPQIKFVQGRELSFRNRCVMNAGLLRLRPMSPGRRRQAGWVRRRFEKS